MTTYRLPVTGRHAVTGRSAVAGRHVVTGRSAVGAWSPALLSPTCWLRGDAVTVDGSSNVSSWTDQSGNGRHFINNTGNQRPAWSSSMSAFGNRAGLTFDGSNDNLALSGAGALSGLISASAYTVWCVFRVTQINSNDATGYNNACLWTDSNDVFFSALKSTGPTLLVSNWDGNEDDVSLTISTGTTYVVIGRHDAGKIYASVNGGTESNVSSGNTSPLTSSTMRLGRNPGGTQFYQGMMAEWGVCNSVLSAANRALIVQYARAYYGF